jgi:hypothetical protein
MHRPDSSTKPCSACSALPFPCFWWLFHRRLFLKALALVGRQPIGFPFAAIFFGKGNFRSRVRAVQALATSGLTHAIARLCSAEALLLVLCVSEACAAEMPR